MDLNEDKLLMGIGVSVIMVGAWSLTAVLPSEVGIESNRSVDN